MNITNILFIYFDKYFDLWDLATNTAANFVKGKRKKPLLLRQPSSSQIINLYREWEESQNLRKTIKWWLARKKKQWIFTMSSNISKRCSPYNLSCINILPTTSNILAKIGQCWLEAGAPGIPVPRSVMLVSENTNFDSFLCPLEGPVLHVWDSSRPDKTVNRFQRWKGKNSWKWVSSDGLVRELTP